MRSLSLTGRVRPRAPSVAREQSNDGAIIKFDAFFGVALLTLWGHGDFDPLVPSSGLWSAVHLPPGAHADARRFRWVRDLAVRGRTLYSTGNDCTLRAWDVESGALLFRHEAHTKEVSCLALGDDAVFTGSNDGWVLQWPLHEAAGAPGRTGVAAAEPIGHYSCEAPVACLAVSAATHDLFTSAYAPHVLCWDAQPAASLLQQHGRAQSRSSHGARADGSPSGAHAKVAKVAPASADAALALASGGANTALTKPVGRCADAPLPAGAALGAALSVTGTGGAADAPAAFGGRAPGARVPPPFVGDASFERMNSTLEAAASADEGRSTYAAATSPGASGAPAHRPLIGPLSLAVQRTVEAAESFSKVFHSFRPRAESPPYAELRDAPAARPHRPPTPPATTAAAATAAAAAALAAAAARRRDGSVQLRTSRVLGDLAPLAVGAPLMEMAISMLQLLAFAFQPHGGAWADGLRAPLLALSDVLLMRLPPSLVWPGFGVAVSLMALVLLAFFGDAHGALVRHAEARRVAADGVQLEIDFTTKSVPARVAPPWLENLRIQLVRAVALSCGALLVPTLGAVVGVFECERVHARTVEGVVGDPTAEAPVPLAPSAVLGSLGCQRPGGVPGGAPGVEVPSTAPFEAAPGGAPCVRCFELPPVEASPWPALAAWLHEVAWTRDPWLGGLGGTLLLLVGLFVLVALRLSTVHHDLARLPLLTASQRVLSSHLLGCWADGRAPAAGPFSPDARGSWLLSLTVTFSKVVLVLSHTRLRTAPALLAALRVALGAALTLAALLFRPFAAAVLCRLQATLMALVLWFFACAAVLQLVPRPGAPLVRLLLTLGSLVGAAPFGAAFWRLARWVYPHDPGRPSLARSHTRTLMLRRRTAALGVED